MQWNWNRAASGVGTLTLGAVLAWAGSVITRDAPPPQALAPRVGVLDLALALRNDPLGKAAAEELELWMASQQQVIDTHDENILELEADIEDYRPGSDEYIQRAEALMLEKYRLELTVERMNVELKVRQAKDFKESYSRVRVAAEEVRKNHGLEIVVQVNPNPLGGRTSGDVISEMIARSTLAYDEQVDITSQVINILKS